MKTKKSSREPLGRVPLRPPEGFATVSSQQRTFWAPRRGDSVRGVLSGRYTDTDPAGQTRHRWVLSTLDGQDVVLPDHYDLSTKLERCRVGDHVWIGYEGRESVSGVPSPMHRYSVGLDQKQYAERQKQNPSSG